MTECQIEWHLADWMKIRGLRNKDLASKAELHHVTISKLKHSKMPERIESSTLERLCVALQCNPGDLICFKHPFQDDTELLDALSSLSQREQLPLKQVQKTSRPIDVTECDRTPDTAISIQQRHELRTSAIDIMGHAITLIELLEKLLPLEKRSQVTPHLVGILADCNKHLRILNDIEQKRSDVVHGEEALKENEKRQSQQKSQQNNSPTYLADPSSLACG